MYRLDALNCSHSESLISVEAFTNRDMTERTMQISLTASGLEPNKHSHYRDCGSTCRTRLRKSECSDTRRPTNHNLGNTNIIEMHLGKTDQRLKLEFVEQLFLNCGGEQTTVTPATQLLRDTKQRLISPFREKEKSVKSFKKVSWKSEKGCEKCKKVKKVQKVQKV